MNTQPTPAPATGRRLVAAGVISRKIDVRITPAGVTGIIRKAGAR